MEVGSVLKKAYYRIAGSSFNAKVGGCSVDGFVFGSSLQLTTSNIYWDEDAS